MADYRPVAAAAVAQLQDQTRLTRLAAADPVAAQVDLLGSLVGQPGPDQVRQTCRLVQPDPVVAGWRHLAVVSCPVDRRHHPDCSSFR